ncbi:hypothetical protein N9933_01035 [bacterium]|nr:hypothetical protein [bacterium]
MKEYLKTPLILFVVIVLLTMGFIVAQTQALVPKDNVSTEYTDSATVEVYEMSGGFFKRFPAGHRPSWDNIPKRKFIIIMSLNCVHSLSIIDFSKVKRKKTTH